jgi:hypothetical protein
MWLMVSPPKGGKVVKSKVGKNTTAKKAKKPASSKWVSTGRKATVVTNRKPTQRTVYRNSSTGELRVRKMVVRPDGTRKVTYVKMRAVMG